MPLLIGSGDVVLEAQPRAVGRGALFRIRCECRFRGGSDYVFNPFLWEGYQLPAQITITSADGKIHHELLRRNEEIADKQGVTAWVRRNCSIGREFTVRIAPETLVTPARHASEKVLDLPPGDYFIQAIYNNWLNAVWPNDPSLGVAHAANVGTDDPQPYARYTRAKMNEPIAISKPIAITVTGESKEQKDDAVRDMFSVRVMLQPPSTKVKFGQHAELEISIANQSDQSLETFNPFLNGWLMARQRAVALAVLTEDGRSVGDLLTFRGGSTGTVTKSDWIVLPPGGIATSRFQYRAGDDGVDLIGDNGLPPGKYFVELRAHKPLLSSPPAIMNQTNDRSVIMSHPSFEEWRQSFPGPEICRSNRVELEILPRTGD